MIPFALIMAERMLAICVGGFLCYLGYRLFLSVPTKENSAGEFKLPGGVGIHLTRVGPGIFFALFGAGIVIVAFEKPAKFENYGTTGAAPTASIAAAASKDSPAEIAAGGDSVPTSFHLDAIGEGPPLDETKPEDRAVLREMNRFYVSWLNKVGNVVGNSQEGDPVGVCKFAIMKRYWSDTEWGDSKKFEEAIKDGTINDKTDKKRAKEFAAALDYFNSK
jgi:hypothetical protein